MADDHSLFLPPGFRFHPTDEEIVVDYLQQKVADERFSAVAMGEVDLNSCEPWEIPKKAKMGEKMWYFFWQKDRKYPTGTRTNRATKEGYWKATGKDKEIYNYKGSSAGKEIRPVPVLVGMKKTLVFYLGRAPKGERTNWVMHEFRLQGSESHQFASNQEEWVVCRIFHKNELGGIKSKSRMEGGTSREQQQMMMMMMMSMTPAATTSNHQENTSYLFSQMPPPPPPPNPNSFSQSGLAAAAAGSWGYLHRQEEVANGSASSTSAFTGTGTGKCKVELQAVSTTNSIRSHSQEDTGINSNDHWHADISSYSSTGEDQYSSAGPLLHNLDNIWEF